MGRIKLFTLLFLLFAYPVSANVVPDKDAQGNIVNKADAFSSKGTYKFRGAGIKCVVAASSSSNCEYVIPMPKMKFNGVSIYNGAYGDTANLKVLDTATGTYTLALIGTAIPNYTLDQFGFNWNIRPDQIELLSYPADVNQGMRIIVEYKNNGTSSKDVYINYYVHEF